MTESAPLESTRQGHLDGCHNAVIVGWAYDTASPDVPLSIDCYVDGRRVGTATADSFRHDLAQAARSGRIAFRYPVPSLLRDGRAHEIAAFYADTKEPLPDSPQRHVIAVDAEASTRHLMGNVDGIEDGAICGWAFETTAPELSVMLRVAIDGKEIARTIPADLFREDLKDAGFGTGHCAFRYPVPDALCDGKPHRVTFTGVRCGTVLPGLETVMLGDD